MNFECKARFKGLQCMKSGLHPHRHGAIDHGVWITWV